MRVRCPHRVWSEPSSLVPLNWRFPLTARVQIGTIPCDCEHLFSEELQGFQAVEHTSIDHLPDDASHACELTLCVPVADRLTLVPPDGLDAAVPNGRALFDPLRLLLQSEPRRPVGRHLELAVNDTEGFVDEEVQAIRDRLLEGDVRELWE